MNGKKSALCNSAEHSHVPVTLSTDLQVISLNENNINYLNREEFYQNGLEHLQRIFVRNSRVQHVHRDAFKNLKILIEIDLSENAIETLEPGTFSGNDRLRILYLYGNPLRRLAADQFPALPHLRTLDLHDCAIESVDERAFARVDQLEYLNLKNNSLPAMGAHVFAHMSALKTLLLEENPWNCDCKLRAFRNWYVKTNYPKLACAQPAKFAATQWDQISEELLGCLPSVELIADHNVQAGEDMTGLTNVSFHCIVSGDPLPQIVWELNGNPLPEGYNVVLNSGSEVRRPTNEAEFTGMWSNLTILNVTNYDSGMYACRAWNLVGEVVQNATLFLPEVVEHVIVKTHETFWYFGLIVGTFGTIFGLLLVSVTICYCRKASLQRNTRRNQKKKKQQRIMGGMNGGSGTGRNGGGGGGSSGGGSSRGMGGSGQMKGSVSFTEREKKLLDLSLTTTTNDRLDSCELVNTPSTTITLNNSISVSGGGGGGYTTHKALEMDQQQQQQQQFQMQQHHLHQQQLQQFQAPMQITVERDANGEFPLNVALFPPPPAEFSCTINNGGPVTETAALGQPHLYSSAVAVAAAAHNGSGTHVPEMSSMSHHSHSNQYNITGSGGCAGSSVANGGGGSGAGNGYGNIFISVSVTQDALDNAEQNMCPDLLNIPNRLKSTSGGGGAAANKLLGDDGSCSGSVNGGNNSASICNSIINNQNNNIIIVNGGGGGEQHHNNQQQLANQPPPHHHQHQHQHHNQHALHQPQQLQEFNGGVGGAYYTNLEPLSNAVSYSSFQLTPLQSGVGETPSLKQQQQQQNQQQQQLHQFSNKIPGGVGHICAFATLPRQPRHMLGQAHLYTSGGGGSGSGSGMSSPNSNGCSGQVTPIVINNYNNTAVCNTINMPPTIHENGDVIAYHNLEASGATLTRPSYGQQLRGSGGGGGSGCIIGDLRRASKLYSSSSSSSSPVQQQRLSSGGEQEIIHCPVTKYDNIGRRITASGNSAIKVPGADDDEGESFPQPPLSWQNSNNIGDSGSGTGNGNGPESCHKNGGEEGGDNGQLSRQGKEEITRRRRMSLDYVPL